MVSFFFCSGRQLLFSNKIVNRVESEIFVNFFIKKGPTIYALVLSINLQTPIVFESTTCILPPTQHHSFFRNLPPLFIRQTTPTTPYNSKLRQTKPNNTVHQTTPTLPNYTTLNQTTPNYMYTTKLHHIPLSPNYTTLLHHTAQHYTKLQRTTPTLPNYNRLHQATPPLPNYNTLH